MTKCTGIYRTQSGDKNCPYAKACYRHTAEPSMRQACWEHGPYSSSQPGGCREFWMDKYSSDQRLLQMVAFARYISFIILGKRIKTNCSEFDMHLNFNSGRN